MAAVIYNISKQSSVVAKHKLFSQMVSSIFLLVLVALGLEALLHRLSNWKYYCKQIKILTKERTLLLACEFGKEFLLSLMHLLQV